MLLASDRTKVVMSPKIHERVPSMIQQRFQIDQGSIVHQTIDDEVVILNLKNGNYYSLRKAGVEIWSALERGLTVADIEQELIATYSGDHATIAAYARATIDQLLHEDIVSISTNVCPGEDSPRDGHEMALRAFEAPIFEKHSDMADLLMLDPIHEVDATGWPRRVGAPTPGETTR